VSNIGVFEEDVVFVVDVECDFGTIKILNHKVFKAEVERFLKDGVVSLGFDLASDLFTSVFFRYPRISTSTKASQCVLFMLKSRNSGFLGSSSEAS